MLEGLDGASKVKTVSKDGDFLVTFKETSKVRPSQIQAALKKYKLERTEIEIAGTLAKADDKPLALSSASGVSYELANREAKDDQDKPEDVVAKLDQALKDGKTVAKVKGVVIENEEKLTIRLESAEVVEAKKE